MQDPERIQRFVTLLTSHQMQLKAFALAMVGDHNDAEDIVQKVNLVLWQKSEQLADLDNFLPWAITVARLRCLAHFREKRRGKLVFDTEIAEAMAEAAVTHLDELPARQLALRECLKQMNSRHRQLLNARYGKNQSVNSIAKQSETTANAISSILKRVRRALMNCIRHRLAQAEYQIKPLS